MCERWKAIPGYEGYYEASTEGRIRSVDRIVSAGRGDGGRFIKGQILRQARHNCKIPYKHVILSVCGLHRTCLVYHLVAITWLGPIPPDNVIRHGPNGYSDDSVSNLCYGTRSDNEKDKKRDGTDLSRRIRRSDGIEFDSMMEAARITECSQGAISLVCNGKGHSAGNYGWSFC